MATKSCSFDDVGAIVDWLTPLIHGPSDFNYTTDRTMKAMMIHVLETEKYETMMRTGKALSPVWSFKVSSLVTAIGRIAMVFRGIFKGLSCVSFNVFPSRLRANCKALMSALQGPFRAYTIKALLRDL